jgi:ATP-dependent Clp protease ATP-binding subunit ClpX
MKSKIYISKKIEKHLGSRFKKILLKHKYKVSYKLLNDNETDIVQILPNSSLEHIDATYNQIKTSDKNLFKCLKVIKRVYCFSIIDTNIAYKEFTRSFDILNKAFLYIQMSDYNKKWHLEFTSVEEMIESYKGDAQFTNLYDVIETDDGVGISEIVELFLEYTDKIFFRNKKKTSKNSTLVNIAESIAFDWQNKELEDNENFTYKLKYNQEDDWYVLTDLFPSLNLNEEKKQQFEELLANSLSLNYKEKMGVIKALPTLSEFQIDELMKVWISEDIRFHQLTEKHSQDIRKLKNKCTEEWISIKHKTLTDSLPSPRKIFTDLRELIKGQDHVLKPLSTILHYQQEIKYSPKNTLETLGPILLAGPTGSGKSFMIKNSANLVNIPYVHVDSSSLVSEGIKGYSLNDVFKDVLRESEFSMKRAESAIVFFDEFDKLLLHHDGIAIINQILRVVEGHKVPITKSFEESREFNDIISLDTSRILFIFGGSFEHILENKRQNSSGFLQQELDSKDLTFKDLEKSGLKKELLGRIKKIFMLNPLNEKEYLNILKTGVKSPIKNYTELLKSTHGKNISIDDNVLKDIAKKAAKLDYGARGLQQIVHELFEKILFEASELDDTYRITMENIDEGYYNV